MSAEVHVWQCETCKTQLRPDFKKLDTDLSESDRVRLYEWCPTCGSTQYLEPRV